MPKNARTQQDGTVLEVLPSSIYRIRLADSTEVLAHLAPEARSEILRLLPGDRARIELSPYTAGRGRIIGKAAG